MNTATNDKQQTTTMVKAKLQNNDKTHMIKKLLKKLTNHIIIIQE
jgi:glycine cleavage system regulatory protein